MSNDVDANWSLPAALVQQSDALQWRLARAGKITASNFRRVMEAKSPRALRTLAREIADDLGRVQRQELDTALDGVAAIRWGRENEAEARALYTLETGNDVADGGFHVWEGHPLVGASPDGLIGSDGGLEIKCPFKREQHHTYGSGPGPVLWQCLGGMLCTGRAWWDFVSFDPRERPELQLYVHRVHRDEAVVQQLAERVVAFADEFLAPVLLGSQDDEIKIDDDSTPNLF